MAEAPEELVVKVRAEFDPAIEDVKRLTLRPGDALAIVLDIPFTPEIVERVSRAVRAMGLPPEHPILVFPSGTKLAVLGSDEAQEQSGGRQTTTGQRA